MRISHCLSIVALIFGLSGLAKAAPIDFRMSVLDGPITGAFIGGPGSFGTVDFGNCPKSLTQQGALGCFTGVNDTGGTITGIDLTFDNTVDPSDPTNQSSPDFLGGQTPNCLPSTFFTNANSPCLLNGSPTDPNAQYILDFSGGTGIAAGTTFYIAEFDVNPDAFQGGQGSVTVSYAATPEPSSILLFTTGIALFGAFAIRRSRYAAPIWNSR
jgi:hypothetical protein